ncbi:MAG: hypothetical protein FJ319_10170 [SAR202 cluster bacterium]|nr:hypothetical protein [SAR202 cluster bacterium]
MPNKIMVITAHPADLVERAGGTVVKHINRGDEVFFVSLTTGAVTHAFNVFPEMGDDKLKDLQKVKDMKKAELDRACKILGVQKWTMLDFPENPMFFTMEEYKVVIKMMREFKPDTVLCPHPTEFGRHDHMDSGRADGSPSPLAPHAVKNVFMFYYQDFRSDQLMGTTRKAPEITIDITDVIDRKMNALDEFATTQTRKGQDRSKTMKLFRERVDGGIGYLNGFAGGAGYGEQFNRLNPERYGLLPI